MNTPLQRAACLSLLMTSAVGFVHAQETDTAKLPFSNLIRAKAGLLSGVSYEI